MLSVNTNTGAMVALQYLDQTNASLMKTQSAINSGLKVASAKDDGATYAIAQNMRGDVAGYAAVTDSLNRGTSSVDVALSAGQSISDLLIEMKSKALAASDCPPLTIEDHALYIYTSGTTGLPKAANMNHYRVMLASYAFAGVIEACAEPRPERPRTWLNDELIALYCALHGRGYAHSGETWVEGRLVGGLYGVSLGAAFFGESMFTRTRDASKVALAALVERLLCGGYRLLDTQFVTDHLRRFGVIEIGRERYRRELQRALATPAIFYSDAGAVVSDTPWTSSVGSAQSITQMS